MLKIPRTRYFNYPKFVRTAGLLFVLLTVFAVFNADGKNFSGGPLVESFLESLGKATLPNSLNGTNCTATPISYGQTITATLDSNCTNPPDTFDDLYSFEGTANDRIAVLMNSTALDSYLFLTDANGNVLATDDNGGTGAVPD